jgi:hypothetical protein
MGRRAIDEGREGIRQVANNVNFDLNVGLAA